MPHAVGVQLCFSAVPGISSIALIKMCRTNVSYTRPVTAGPKVLLPHTLLNELNTPGAFALRAATSSAVTLQSSCIQLPQVFELLGVHLNTRQRQRRTHWKLVAVGRLLHLDLHLGSVDCQTILMRHLIHSRQHDGQLCRVVRQQHHIICILDNALQQAALTRSGGTAARGRSHECPLDGCVEGVNEPEPINIMNAHARSPGA